MKTQAEVVASIKSQLNELQTWFAARPYGFRDHASPEQLQQWTDREREEESLLSQLERQEG